MDIFNRPPAISEDTLQYKLYPPPEQADRTTVTSLAAQIDSFVQSLLPNHIWHRDAFELKVVPDPEVKEKWLLQGLMRVGDSVDDEWCVVWLLREISKQWNVAISVNDSDGEFLLIEAADYLPRWVTPTNSENRVWIYRSHLHLIPLSYLSPPSTRPKRRRHEGSDDEVDAVGNDEDDEWVNVQDALQVLRSRELTEAPSEVEQAVWQRISGYPDAARQHVHVAKAYLPVDIAKALSQNPPLVQRAVETFYTRDAVQLRAAHRMSRFPPKPEVLTPVRMTRPAYAQLVGQKFHPPKVFGQFKEREGTKEWRWRDIGMKLACGFEMSYQESKSRSEGISSNSLKVSADARREALRRNVEYYEYIKKLQSAGYFGGELEGSKLWNELEDKAAEVYVNTKREDDNARLSFAALVNTAIAQAGDNASIPNIEEDPDDWLNIDAENFEQRLSEPKRPGSSNVKTAESRGDAMDVDKSTEEDKETRLAEAHAKKLQGLAKKFEKFVEGEGTLEGAVFEDEKMSEDEQLSDFSDEKFSSDSDSEDEQLKDTERDDAARAARQEAMERLVPALDPADYGKMPASYYSNSQKVAPVTMETEMREEIAPNGKIDLDAEPPKKKPIRRPMLPRDRFDGVDSDDETDEEGEGDEESEEEKPQIIGEIEIDMSEEREDFIRFSREALGINDEMWKEIVKDRESRGAFVPKGIDRKQKHSKPTDVLPASNQRETSRSSPQLRSPQAGPRLNTNLDLDSFEKVMEAMEAELEKARLAKESTTADIQASTTRRTASGLTSSSNKKVTGKDKGKGKAPGASEVEIRDHDIEAAMDAELHAALAQDDDESGEDEPMDYGLIKNFLESFKSQAGLSGPVSNLAGRLEPGLRLPRDSS